VRWVDGRWELRDLGSRNGTFVHRRRLGQGERTTLAPGVSFSLGGAIDMTFEDASPPVASARRAATGTLRVATAGMLVLPDEERPEVSIFEGAGGAWIAEQGDEARPVRDHDVVVADGEGWILDLPTTGAPTWEVGVDEPTLETITLRFAVSLDEETIELTIVHEGQAMALPSRTHHYLLLTLARARLADAEASRDARGWVDRDTLRRMLAVERAVLNVDVFRARRQLASLGVRGAVGIIERRPGSTQLRLGTDRVEITRL
jgi:hypothetical protein